MGLKPCASFTLRAELMSLYYSEPSRTRCNAPAFRHAPRQPAAPRAVKAGRKIELTALQPHQTRHLCQTPVNTASVTSTITRGETKNETAFARVVIRSGIRHDRCNGPATWPEGARPQSGPVPAETGSAASINSPDHESGPAPPAPSRPPRKPRSEMQTPIAPRTGPPRLKAASPWLSVKPTRDCSKPRSSA